MKVKADYLSHLVKLLNAGKSINLKFCDVWPKLVKAFGGKGSFNYHISDFTFASLKDPKMVAVLG